MLLSIHIDKKLLEKKNITLQTKVAIALHKMKYSPSKIFLASLGISRTTYWRVLKHSIINEETYGKGFLKVDVLHIWVAGLENAVLYTQILEYANMKEGAFPSEKILAKNLGISLRAVKYYKQQLLILKVLKWKKIQTNRGNLSCLYTPCFKIAPAMFQNCTRFVSKLHLVCFNFAHYKESYKELYKEYYKTVSIKSKPLKIQDIISLKTVRKKIPKILKGDSVKLSDLLEQDIDNQIIKDRKEKIKGLLTISKVIEFWRLCLSSYGYTQYHSFTGQEKGLMKSLLKRTNEEGKINLNEFLEFCISNWNDLNKKVSINKSRLRMKPVPTFQEIYFMKEELLPLFLKLFRKSSKVIDKVIFRKIEDIPKDHPQYGRIVSILSKGRIVKQN